MDFLSRKSFKNYAFEYTEKYAKTEYFLLPYDFSLFLKIALSASERL
jgi:hypothetical protein